MKKGVTLLFVLFCLNSIGQNKNEFSINTGLRLPHLAVVLKFNYAITNKLELSAGLDANAINTLGRTIGLQFNYFTFSDKETMLFGGLDYDNTSPGIYNYHDENSPLSGSATIPNNSYIIPYLGIRFYGGGNTKTTVKKGVSISFRASYKVPLNYQPLTYRSGDLSQSLMDIGTKFSDGGLNFELRVGLWLGKKQNK